MLEVLVYLILFVFEVGAWVFGMTPAQRQRAHEKEVARKMRDNERASRRQQQEWLAEVRRQKSRGSAGFADEAAARAALRGRGGRPSNLDDRWF
jgi:hypothetical protein